MLNTNVYSVRYLKTRKVQSWSDLKLVLTYKLVHIDVQLEDGPQIRSNKLFTIDKNQTRCQIIGSCKNIHRKISTGIIKVRFVMSPIKNGPQIRQIGQVL